MEFVNSLMSENITKQQNYTNRPHILVVDDDKRIRELLARYLGARGYIVLAAEDAAHARESLERFAVDVIILDVMMPGQNGVEFAAELRGQGVSTPIVLLTALGETQDRITGLEAGADDYISKPFEPRELLLRLEVIIKRTMQKHVNVSAVRFGPWVYELDSQMITSEHETVRLTSTEVLLMKALMAHVGQVLSRDELASFCGIDAGERTIDVQVTRLRKKFEEDSKNPRYLQTIRGKGYRLLADVL